MYGQINDIKSFLVQEDINIVVNYIIFKKALDKKRILTRLISFWTRLLMWGFILFLLETIC